MRNKEDVSTSSKPHETPLGFLLVLQLGLFENHQRRRTSDKDPVGGDQWFQLNHNYMACICVYVFM